jgi:hypothetical protein
LEVDDEACPSTQIHGMNKKNSSNLTAEKLGKNTLKTTKKKNDPYNLETRFTHKDQLYSKNQTPTRCGNRYNILPLLKDWRDLSLSLLSSLTPRSTSLKKQL